MNRKIAIVSLIISIIVVTSVTISITYSLWTKSFNQVSYNSIDIGCFKVSFSDSNISGGGDISLANAYPMYDEDGKKLTPYKFTIENTCDISSNYIVNLETLDTSTMDESKLDVYFDEGKVKMYSSNVVNGLSSDAKNGMSLYRGYLAAGSSVTHSLRVWIDSSVTKNTANVPGKNWNGRISVNSEAAFNKLSFGSYQLLDEYIVYNINKGAKTISSITCYYGDEDNQNNLGEAIGTTSCKFPLNPGYIKFIATYDDNTTESIEPIEAYHEEEIDYGDSLVAIGPVGYATIKDAINTVAADGNIVKIKLLQSFSVSESITTIPGQNIEIDFNGKTIDNGTASIPVIQNQGTMILKNGNILSTAAQGAVNNENKVSGSTFAPVMTIIDFNITSKGTKQAVYNKGGNMEIYGNTYLYNKSSNRAALHNLKNTDSGTVGNITIYGAEIVGNGSWAISNEAGNTITLGVNDGTIDNTSISATGKTYAISNSGTFNFYDGVLKGITNVIEGTTYSGHDDTATYKTGTETIDGNTYKTAYFEK